MKNHLHAIATVIFAMVLTVTTFVNPQHTTTSDVVVVGAFENQKPQIALKSENQNAGFSRQLSVLLTEDVKSSAGIETKAVDIVAAANIEDEETSPEEAEYIYIDCNETRYSSGDLYVRSGPGTEYDIIGLYHLNDDVHISAKKADTDWVKIEYGNTEAYVNQSYLMTEKITEQYLGNFQLTGYCACVKCCGNTKGITASGTHVTAGRTIAADESIPFGTKLKINGIVYTVEDRGSAVNGNHVDIYFDTHEEAAAFAVQYADVYLIIDEN